MSVIGTASVRSCGVSTLVAGLAMLWPGEGFRILIETDPAGGVLAAGAGLAPEPGLVSLAAAARRGGDPRMVFEHSQALMDGTAVVCGPPGADRARSALSMAAGLLGRVGELDATVILDCGRLDDGGPNANLFEQADLKVIATRPRLADLHALAAFLERRELEPERTVLVLVDSGPYPPGEVAEALGLPVASQVPWDPEAAAAIPSTPLASRRLTRTPLVRALRSLAGELVGRVQSLDSSAMAANGSSHALEVNR